MANLKALQLSVDKQKSKTTCVTFLIHIILLKIKLIFCPRQVHYQYPIICCNCICFPYWITLGSTKGYVLDS